MVKIETKMFKDTNERYFKETLLKDVLKDIK